jgi:hypothetical protein
MNKFTNLRSLSFENVDVTDDMLIAFPCLPTLKTLRLVYCENITPAALAIVFEKTKLNTLKLENCILINAIGELPSTLTNLALVNLASLSARDIATGIVPCEELGHVDLNLSGIDDEGLKTILIEAKAILVLNVCECKKVKDIDGIVGRFASMTLRRLKKSSRGAFQRRFVGRPGLVVEIEE